MKFNLADKDEAIQAQVYFDKLRKHGSLCEVKAISLNRTLKQNSYLHVLLGAFGQHFGYTMEEAKTIYKQMNVNIYTYAKKNRTFWRSSADLNVEEMTASIETLRERSDAHGYPLPEADNGPWIRQLQNAIEQSKKYL